MESNKDVTGVLAYFIRSIGRTVAVAFFVSKDQGASQWNISLLDGKREADHDLYIDLFSKDPFIENGEWQSKNLNSGFKADGQMLTKDGKATLQILVFRTGQANDM